MRYMFLGIFFLLWVLSVSAQPLVQIIYFQPSDVKAPSVSDFRKIKEVMVAVQLFFASEMERYGFGPKTFSFNPNIKVIKAKEKASFYDHGKALKDEGFELEYEVPNKVVVIFLGGRENLLNKRTDKTIAGLEETYCWSVANEEPFCNFFVVIPFETDDYLLPATAHEIAHAFRLSHSSDIVKGRINLMNTPHTIQGGVKEELSRYGIRDIDAAFLNKNDRFSIQRNIPISDQVLDADVNGDGYVDLSDVLIVRSGIQNAVSYDTDVNNDGKTDEIDVLIVKAKAVEEIVAAAPMLLGKRRKVGTWGELKGGLIFGK